MATQRAFDAVLAANHERQRRAQDLNMRAGKPLFPVLTADEIRAFLAKGIPDAISIASIPSAEAIRFPTLDENMVASVLRELPDTITVLGQEYIVTYEENGLAYITLEDWVLENNSWTELPAELKFPGGRNVSVSVYLNHMLQTFLSLADLKQSIRAHLNQAQWERWHNRQGFTSRPVPDLSLEGARVPEIVPVEYGKCVVDGTPLLAYEVLGSGESSRALYQRARQFRFFWKYERTEAEAKITHAATMAQYVLYQENLRLERERRDIESKMHETRIVLHQLHRTYVYSNEIESAVRIRISQLVQSEPTLHDLTVCLVWIGAVSSIAAEIKASTTKLQLASDRKAAYLKKILEFGARIFLWVDKEGNLYVYCGQALSRNTFDMKSGMRDGRCYGPRLAPTLPDDAVWQRAEYDTILHCRELNRSSPTFEIRFRVGRDHLPAGIWGVASDRTGKFFHSVMYIVDGHEFVPDPIVKIREDQPGREEIALTVGNLALSQLFGGNAEVLIQK